MVSQTSMAAFSSAARQLSGSVDQLPVMADCLRALGRHKAVDALWDDLRHASPSDEVLAEGRIVVAGSLADRGDIAGGIAPKILPKLAGPMFMQAFVSKGRMQSLLESIPVRVAVNDKTALLGAARCAAMKAAT